MYEKYNFLKETKKNNGNSKFEYFDKNELVFEKNNSNESIYNFEIYKSKSQPALDLDTNEDNQTFKLSEHINNEKDDIENILNNYDLKKNAEENEFLYSPNNKIFFEEFGKRMNEFIRLNIESIKS